MIGNDVLRWALTAMLLAASLYAAVRAGRKSAPAARVGLALHAAMLAAMAFMLAAMDAHGAGASLAGAEAAGLPGRAPHHGGPAVGLLLQGSLAGAEQGWGSQAAAVLAVAFGGAGAVWGLLLLWRLRSPGRPRSGDAFLELAGTASMAVMFAALAA